MSAGMAYEAMNNAGATKSRLIVILNDNDMSIARPVGAMSRYFSRLISGHAHRSSRDNAGQRVHPLPESLERKSECVEAFTRGFWTGGTLFEDLGFHYVA